MKRFFVVAALPVVVGVGLVFSGVFAGTLLGWRIRDGPRNSFGDSTPMSPDTRER